MAIFVRGQSRCPLCGIPIEDGEKVIAFSPFVFNEADPLFQFNDSAFHADCFQRHPLAAECQAVYEQTRKQLGPGHRVCAVCEGEMNDPDEFFTLGYLSSDSESPLFAYNGFQAHRLCLADSEELTQLCDLLEESQKRGELTGHGVQRLLDELREMILKGSSRVG